MIDPYLHGEISAKLVCILCYFAGLAGIVEAVGLGLPPNNPSGHFQRKLDSALELRTDDAYLYRMGVPMSPRGSDRDLLPANTIPPHESLRREFKAHPELQTAGQRRLLMKSGWTVLNRTPWLMVPKIPGLLVDRLLYTWTYPSLLSESLFSSAPSISW